MYIKCDHIDTNCSNIIDFFKKTSLQELPTKSPFPCPCVLEVWKHVKMLVDHAHQRSRGEEVSLDRATFKIVAAT